jgi:predicted kinase
LVDATFSRRKWRTEARTLARDQDANIVFVECACSRETIESRLRDRGGQMGESDARLPILDQLLAEFQPASELPEEMHLRVDTEASLDSVLARIAARAYERQKRQVRQRMASL